MTVPPGAAETRAALLVLAKAPVPGLAKTRLSPPASPRDAARIAAAALLDTLCAVRAACRALPGTRAMVAWTGELDEAREAGELRRALSGLTRYPQRGDTLGSRIASAHADASDRAPGASVLQIGMDTPQIQPAELVEALRRLHAPGGPDAVLGPAQDGGWWALGLRDPRAAAFIEGVETSRSDTGERTVAALRAAGLRVALLPLLRDVDTAADALAVAALESVGRRFRSVTAEVLGADPADRPIGGTPA